MGNFWHDSMYGMMIDDEAFLAGNHKVHIWPAAGGTVAVPARRYICVPAGMAIDRDIVCSDVHCRSGDDEAEPGAFAKAAECKRRTA